VFRTVSDGRVSHFRTMSNGRVQRLRKSQMEEYHTMLLHYLKWKSTTLRVPCFRTMSNGRVQRSEYHAFAQCRMEEYNAFAKSQMV
jgi:hypothetical protein